MQKKKINKTKVHFIFATISLITCFVVVVGAVYAWFVISKTPSVSGTEMSFTDGDHKGYVFTEINNRVLLEDDENYIIYPGDKVKLTVKAISNNEDFGIRINPVLLSNDDFKAFFEDRDDLLSAIYRKVESYWVLDEGVTKLEGIQSYFDLDEYLTENADILAANSVTARECKLEFLRQFVLQNSILDFVTMTLVYKGESYPLERKQNVTAQYSDVYYPVELLTFEYDEQAYIEFEFCTNDFVASAVFGSDQEIFEEAKYIARNFNCFIGQIMRLSFEDKREEITP